MRLFKFVSSTHAVLNMARGSLKFTPLPELNDPSELTPVMSRAAVGKSLQALRLHGLTKDQYRWLRCQDAVLSLLAPQEKVLDAPRTLEEANRMLSISVYDNLDYMERKLFATIELIRANVGILSLSERYDSLPMWAHYADQAKGFVVIFEDMDKVFKGDQTGSLNVTKPVDYTEEFVGMTFDPSTQDRLFFSKLKDWSYEREWRVVTALEACRRSPDGKLFLRDITPSPLTGVICGWRVSEQDRLLLRRDLEQVNPRIEVITAALDRGKVTLNSALH
jgi:hypothetical protein